MAMVDRSGGYFRRPFKGYRGMTQGEPLPPTIFNVVMDYVIRHWVTVVIPTEAGTGGLGLMIIDLAEYLYDNNGLVAPNQLERPQRAFVVLTSLFDRVGLRTNTGKMFSMVCQPCHASGRMLEEAYERWTTGIWPTFWEWQRRSVECPE